MQPALFILPLPFTALPCQSRPLEAEDPAGAFLPPEMATYFRHRSAIAP